MMTRWQSMIVKGEDPTPLYRGTQSPPLPYPEGWFILALSAQLAPGSVITRRLMGEDVVLYRTLSGRLRVIRPYCPHLGAHLGCGGRIDGEDIVCPFHHFAYGPDGNVTRHGPGYADHLLKEKITLLPCEEANGIIYIWAGHSSPLPTWKLPPVLMAEGVTARFVTVAVPTHPQEVCENVVDVGHIRALHGYLEANETSPPDIDGQQYTTHLSFTRKITPFWRMRAKVTVNIYGLGLLHAIFEEPRVGLRVEYLVGPRPVESWRVHLTVGTVMTRIPDRGLPSRVPRAVFRAACRAMIPLVLRTGLTQEIGVDIPIWETKKYAAPPRISHGDGAIGPYRKWASQFYPKN